MGQWHHEGALVYERLQSTVGQNSSSPAAFRIFTVFTTMHLSVSCGPVRSKVTCLASSLRRMNGTFFYLCPGLDSAKLFMVNPVEVLGSGTLLRLGIVVDAIKATPP